MGLSIFFELQCKWPQRRIVFRGNQSSLIKQMAFSRSQAQRRSTTTGCGPTFDPFKDEMPDLQKATFDVKIKQSWFRTDVEFLPNKKTPLLSSKTDSVEFFKSENGTKSIAWVYEQTNKQDNTQRLAVTDQPKFRGAAVLTVNEDASEIQGEYWQNRSWDKGLNAAGLIVLKRKRR